jgi:hypothetical protein
MTEVHHDDQRLMLWLWTRKTYAIRTMQLRRLRNMLVKITKPLLHRASDTCLQARLYVIE